MQHKEQHLMKIHRVLSSRYIKVEKSLRNCENWKINYVNIKKIVILQPA
jgi:hypothetical protein